MRVARVISVINQMEADGAKNCVPLFQFIEAAAIDAERFQRIIESKRAWSSSLAQRPAISVSQALRDEHILAAHFRGC